MLLKEHPCPRPLLQWQHYGHSLGALGFSPITGCLASTTYRSSGSIVFRNGAPPLLCDHCFSHCGGGSSVPTVDPPIAMTTLHASLPQSLLSLPDGLLSLCGQCAGHHAFGICLSANLPGALRPSDIVARSASASEQLGPLSTFWVCPVRLLAS